MEEFVADDAFNRKSGWNVNVYGDTVSELYRN